MNIILVLATLFILPAFAQDLPLDNYVKMQEALANDDYNSAQEIHKQLCTKELSKLAKEYKDCNKKFTDIDDLRNSFKTLSKVYMAHAKKDEMKGLMKANCPMAGAQWIQKTGIIKNPYYGKSMLECGEKI